jgi:hypothetical protein
VAPPEGACRRKISFGNVRQQNQLAPPAALLHSFEDGDLAGRSDMANRLPSAVATALSLFVVLSVNTSRAADPGFCKQYTQAALIQVRGGLANDRCASGLQGSRWSTEFAVHYEWCLGASVDAASAERDARTRFLKACNAR